MNISSFVSKYFFINKIILREPCKGGSLVEKNCIKDSESCRAGSLEEMEELRIGKEWKIKSKNYTEKALSYTERIRKTINR